MNLEKIGHGKGAPDSVNVVIEISANSGPIKYEFDKDTGALLVDRIMPTSMSYPCNYGFIPNTLSGDGDPVDVLVYTNFPIIEGAVITCKPVAVLITEDEKGKDEKVLAVPCESVDLFFKDVHSIEDLPEMLQHKLVHFFENYKKLEKGKWVKVTGWGDAAHAKNIIIEAIKRNTNE